MEILKIIETLQSYSEDVVKYKLDGKFAHAVTEAVELLVTQGEKIAELEEKTRWVPVTERLPDLIPCDAGTAYSEAVSVLTSGRKVFTAIWDQYGMIADAEFWEAAEEEITHWAPTPLPLPKIPKEETK